LLATVDVPTGAVARLLVVGGTGEYLARLIPPSEALNAETVETVLDRLAGIAAQALAGEIGIAEARARVLPAGIAVIAALVDRIQPGKIEVARSGIRTGLLLATFAERATDRS
jgi:exopolyphosphatase/pppGpp-phosphohydrolase